MHASELQHKPHVQLSCCTPHCAPCLLPPPLPSGREYEARLRQQHNKLNPRTSWASLKKADARRRRQAEGGASDSEEEGETAAERLLQRAGGLLARGSALPPAMLETTRLKDANQADACKGAVK